MINLRKLRKEKKLTQKQFGDLIGCSASTMSRYETRKQRIPFDILKKMRREFGNIPISCLLEDDVDYGADFLRQELDIALLFREADERARKDAIDILSKHSTKDNDKDKENPA